MRDLSYIIWDLICKEISQSQRYGPTQLSTMSVCQCQWFIIRLASLIKSISGTCNLPLIYMMLPDCRTFCEQYSKGLWLWLTAVVFHMSVIDIRISRGGHQDSLQLFHDTQYGVKTNFITFFLAITAFVITFFAQIQTLFTTILTWVKKTSKSNQTRSTDVVVALTFYVLIHIFIVTSQSLLLLRTQYRRHGNKAGLPGNEKVVPGKDLQSSLLLHDLDYHHGIRWCQIWDKSLQWYQRRENSFCAGQIPCTIVVIITLLLRAITCPKFYLSRTISGGIILFVDLIRSSGDPRYYQCGSAEE